MTTHEKRSNGPRDIQRLIRVVSFGLAVAAVVKEVRTPAEQREWHGVVVGFVPYDFRVPTVSRLKQRMWDPNASHMVNPRVFGVGWTVNVGKVVSVARRQLAS